jgi:hypothetical protein
MFKDSVNGRKADSFEFNKKEKAAFELLKIFFIRAFMLIHFKSDKQIRIEVTGAALREKLFIKRR